MRGTSAFHGVGEIPRRQLGRTGLSVTALGFGAMELSGPPRGPEIDAPHAGRLLNSLLDRGVNFIDTSIDYGRSEELIGEFISHRRDEFVLASKCGCVPGAPMAAPHVHTAANIRAGVEHSLRTLNTDHLDIVQFHRSLKSEEFDADGAIGELLTMRSEGKVRFIGVSGEAPNITEQIEMGVFDVFQVPYSALQREHENIITRAATAGAGIVVRGGVARGAPEDWENRMYYMVSSDTMRDRWDRAGLDDLLDGMGRVGFMLRFVLSHPSVATAIVGTRKIEHLHDNIAAACEGPLSDDVYAAAKSRLSSAGATPL